MRLIKYLWSKLKKIQCEGATSRCDQQGRVIYRFYCVRAKHHYGSCCTNNGTSFIPPIENMGLGVTNE